MEKLNKEIEILLKEETVKFSTMDIHQCKEYIINIKNDNTIKKNIKPYIIAFYLEAYLEAHNSDSKN